MHDDTCRIGSVIRGLDMAAPVTLSLEDRRQHVHIVGKSGVGKTTVLKSMIFAALQAGENFALLDPLGGLAESVVDAVPSWRNDRAIYFDPGSDLEHCLGFNPVARVPHDLRHLVADHLLAAFMHVWDVSLEDTPSLVYVLYHALRLLLEVDGTTLLGLPRLLVDDAYRRTLLKQCRDVSIAKYWETEFAALDERKRATVISPVQNKIGMLLAPPALKCILGQTRSTIDIARLMNEGGVLIANLSKGKLGATGAHLLGAFLATTISQVAEERIAIPFEQRRDFTLYADEVQNFATTNFASTLSEARNFKLSCVLAHQFMSQLPQELADSIFGNCGTEIVFRVNSVDARRLADELDMDNHRTLSNTANYHAWVRQMYNGAPTDAMFMTTRVPEPRAVGRKAAVIAHTRARHTRPRAVVERSIALQILGQIPDDADPIHKARRDLAARLQLAIDHPPAPADQVKGSRGEPETSTINALLKD